MPIINVTRAPSEIDMRELERGITEFREGYDCLLELEDGVHPLTIIRDSPLLPQPGDFHPDFLGFRARPREVKNLNDSPIHWLVTVPYSNRVTGAQITEPWLEPPQFRFGGRRVDEPVDTDLDDTPFATTAGEPFDPPHMRATADVVIDYSFVAPETQINVPWLLSYRDKTNSDAWPGVCAAGEALIDGTPEAVYVYAAGDVPAHYQCRMRILFRQNPTAGDGVPEKAAWMSRKLNQGYRFLFGGDLFTAKDTGGTPLNMPVLLDAAGARTATPHWLYFRDFDEAPFAPLNIQLPPGSLVLV